MIKILTISKYKYIKIIFSLEVLDFGKIRRNKIKRKNITIKNPGYIPATVFIRCVDSSVFKCLSVSEYTLMPKEVKHFEIQFNPVVEGLFTDTLKIHTHSNPYEKFDLELQGSCYFDILSFENLADKSDCFEFDDILLTESDIQTEIRTIDSPMQIINNGDRIIYDMSLPTKLIPKIAIKDLEVKNFSHNCIRFEWKINDPCISIKPSIGHIGSFKTRKFQVRIHKTTDLKSFKLDLSLEFSEIAQENDSDDQLLFEVWDNSKRIKVLVDQDTLANLVSNWEIQNGKTKGSISQFEGQNKNGLFEVFRVLPEPNYVIISDDDNNNNNSKMLNSKIAPKKQKSSAKSITLRVSANIDTPKIETQTKHINFETTMMYLERAHTFKVSNNSSIDLPIKTKIVDLANPDFHDPSYFEITPPTKILPKNSESEFCVKFRPLECNENDKEFERTLLVYISESNLSIFTN